MFEEFKAKHGGLGPIQSLVDRSTGGELSNRIRLKAIGGQMDDTLASIKSDPNVSDDFKGQAAELLRHGVFSGDQALKNIAAVQQGAADQSSAANLYERFSGLQEHLRGQTVSPDDEAQLTTFDVQGATARDMMRSLNPEVAKNGQALALSVFASQREYAKDNETQHIAAANLKEKNGIDAENLRASRDLELGGKLSANVKPIDDQLDSLSIAHTLNNDPKADNIQRELAFNNVITALDPGGRRDPDGRYAGANGLAVQLQNAYERAQGKKDATAFNAVNEIISTAVGQLEQQRTRAVTTASRQAALYGGSPERVTSSVPPRDPLNLKGGDAPATTDTNPNPDPNAPPAAKPSLIERAAAGAKAVADVANQNLPDSVKTGLTAGAGFSVPELVKRGVQLFRSGTGLVTAAESIPVIAALGGMLAINNKPPNKMEGESDEEYAARISAMMAGEDIFTPRPQTLNMNFDEFRK
jgi:hypothetical protein